MKVLLLTVAMASVIGLNLGQSEPPRCCLNWDRFTASLQQTIGIDFKGMDPFVEIMSGSLYVDIPNQKLAFPMTMYFPATGLETNMKVVIDYNTGWEYFILADLATCTKIQVNFPKPRKCWLKDATFINTVTLGENLIADTWRFTLPPYFEAYLTVSRQSCLPVNDVVYGGFPYGKSGRLNLMVNQQFSNVTQGVANPNVFMVPDDCKEIQPGPVSKATQSQYSLYTLLLSTVALVLCIAK